MVGFAVASTRSAPAPVYAPRSDRVRPLTQAVVRAFRQPGSKGGPCSERSRTEPVLSDWWTRPVPLRQPDRSSTVTDIVVDNHVDDVVVCPGHGSPMVVITMELVVDRCWN